VESNTYEEVNDSQLWAPTPTGNNEHMYRPRCYGVEGPYLKIVQDIRQCGRTTVTRTLSSFVPTFFRELPLMSVNHRL